MFTASKTIDRRAVPLVSRALLVAATSIALTSLTLSSPLAAQIPNEFTNLELLPKDIERAEIVRTMRGWAGSLGVRCAYCHVGPDNLQGMDFASDEKATKRTARQMLKMSRRVNGELLEALPTVDGKHQVVSCYTCHRGQTKPPRNTVSILEAELAGGGVAAAIAEYERLVAEHGGQGQYDLSSRMLGKLARRSLEAEDGEAAVAILEYAVEAFPDSAATLATLGMAQIDLGRPERAREALEAALEIDPELEWAKQALARITVAQ